MTGFEDELVLNFVMSETPSRTTAKRHQRNKCTNKIIVPVDKTGNLYKVEKENCKKYLRDHITRTYKKSTHSKVNRVDID